MIGEVFTGWTGRWCPPAEARAFRVFGDPAPQGSKHARPIYRGTGADRVFTGKVAQVESSKVRVNAWRDDVKAAVQQHFGCRCADPGCSDLVEGLPLTGPLWAYAVFSLARPKGHYRTGRNAHLLRDGAPVRPGSKPDLSKLIRSTEDAATAVGLWRDDGQVTEYVRLAKVWCGEDPYALKRPGLVMYVWAAPARSDGLAPQRLELPREGSGILLTGPDVGGRPS